MAASILHRVTGVGALCRRAGAGGWALCLASGPGAYAAFAAVAGLAARQAGPDRADLLRSSTTWPTASGTWPGTPAPASSRKTADTTAWLVIGFAVARHPGRLGRCRHDGSALMAGIARRSAAPAAWARPSTGSATSSPSGSRPWRWCCWCSGRLAGLGLAQGRLRQRRDLAAFADQRHPLALLIGVAAFCTCARHAHDHRGLYRTGRPTKARCLVLNRLRRLAAAARSASSRS